MPERSGSDPTSVRTNYRVARRVQGSPLLRQSISRYGDNPCSVTTGDFNGDGKTDLATANAVSKNISVLLGNGDGTFAAAVNYAAGDDPSSVTTGDFNGDGKTDLAAANSDSDNISVLLGNGNGTFAVAVNYAAGDAPFSVTTGDFNGDGKSRSCGGELSFRQHLGALGERGRHVCCGRQLRGGRWSFFGHDGRFQRRRQD